LSSAPYHPLWPFDGAKSLLPGRSPNFPWWGRGVAGRARPRPRICKYSLTFGDEGAMIWSVGCVVAEVCHACRWWPGTLQRGSRHGGRDDQAGRAGLGHSSIQTTERYTHVTQPALARIKSPLDNMQLSRRRSRSPVNTTRNLRVTLACWVLPRQFCVVECKLTVRRTADSRRLRGWADRHFARRGSSRPPFNTRLLTTPRGLAVGLVGWCSSAGLGSARGAAASWSVIRHLSHNLDTRSNTQWSIGIVSHLPTSNTTLSGTNSPHITSHLRRPWNVSSPTLRCVGTSLTVTAISWLEELSVNADSRLSFNSSQRMWFVSSRGGTYEHKE